METSFTCKLCGLPVRETKPDQGQDKDHFCCNGCRMVYAMLLDSDQYRNASDFTETELYKKCVAAGIIPDATNKTQQTPTANTIPAPTTPPPLSTPVQELSQSEIEETLVCAFNISNMWCPACAWIVEDALRKTKGVIQATCNFSSDRGKVIYDPVRTSPEKILKTVSGLGYHVVPQEMAQKKPIGEFVRLAVTAFLTMNIMMFSWSIYSGFFWELSRQSLQLLAWPVWFMATVVLLYGGKPIFTRALAGVKAGTPGMETLIAAGSLTSYTYSVFNLVDGSLHLYFDASAMLILLILIGKKLEQSARDKISAALADFFSLAPEKVRLCTDSFPNGRYVSVKQLAKGDIFQAEQGEILAADGIVLEGEAMIDESSITGEVKPYKAKVDSMVKSGTRMLSGLIRVKALQVGTESVLGKMMTIMENSLSGKTQKTARFESWLKYFVPGVIGIAVLTFLYGIVSGLPLYESLNRGISVMVISCPCALGIAIPLALVAGVSVASKTGILVRNFEAFERSRELNSFVFDKTGTLTTGKLQVLDLQILPGFTKAMVLELACALEYDSHHYIALTLKDYGRSQGVVPASVAKIQPFANGIAGEYQGKGIRLGNRDFINAGTETSWSSSASGSQPGQVVSQIAMTIDGALAAVFTFGDVVRPGVKRLIAELRHQQHPVFLISGDAQHATLATAIAAGIDLDNSRGGLLPHEKAQFIGQLKQNGNSVAMIGDGMNDAPAMAESDLAVAVHSGLNPGTGVAAITLMREDPSQLLDFLSLAQRVNKTVKQNLIGALVYNLIGIPIAASGLLNPIIAASAMLVSSLSVTINTLRLVKKEFAD